MVFGRSWFDFVEILGIVLVGVLVFVIARAGTPKFAVGFDLKLGGGGGGGRAWGGLADWTCFGCSLTLYFDGFDFGGSWFSWSRGLGRVLGLGSSFSGVLFFVTPQQ